MASGAPRFSRSPHAVFSPVDEERAALLDSRRALTYALNEAGILLWRSMEGPVTLAQMADALVEAFDVDRPLALEDAGEFVAELLALGLVREDDGGGLPAEEEP